MNNTLLNVHSVLRDKIEQVEIICKRHSVKQLYVFGSVCTPYFNNESDIDLLVGFEEPFFNGYADNFFDLEESLSTLLNRKVDLVAIPTLQNPYFIQAMNQTKTLIYE